MAIFKSLFLFTVTVLLQCFSELLQKCSILKEIQTQYDFMKKPHKMMTLEKENPSEIFLDASNYPLTG